MIYAWIVNIVAPLTRRGILYAPTGPAGGFFRHRIPGVDR
jgi:hypothetical protein